MTRYVLILALLFVLPLYARAAEPVMNSEMLCIPVDLIKRDGQLLNMSMEVAATPSSSRRGLMFREFLPPLGGMIFVFHPAEDVAMWMKNTLIPLDMLFIAPDNRIIHIHENAKPHDLTPLPSGGITRYVIELRGGTAAKYGINTGDYIKIPSAIFTFQ